MGPGLQGAGPRGPGAPGKWRTRDGFVDAVEAVIKQDVVDIMLVSVSDSSASSHATPSPATGMKPAIRADDATNISVMRGSPYATMPSRPSPRRLAVARAFGRGDAKPNARNLTHRSRPLWRTDDDVFSTPIRSLEGLQRLSRRRGRRSDFRYFFEVFNPDAGLICTDVMPY